MSVLLSPLRSIADARLSRDGGGGSSGHNPGNNLHVSGLSGRVEERDLEDAFAKYGRVSVAHRTVTDQ